MSAARRWIRLDVTWSRSAWLIMLSPGARLAWIELLSYVKAYGISGRAKAMDPMAAAKCWNIQIEDVKAMLEAAREDGALTTVDGDWLVTGWATYQETDTTAAERQRRYRATKSQHSPLRRDDRDTRDVTDDNRHRGRNLSMSMSSSKEVGVSSDNPESLSGGSGGRRKPERPLPETWTPTASHRSKAKEHGLDVDQQAERFRTHAATHDRRVRNWDAAFRNWLLKAQEFTGNRKQQKKPRRVSADGTILSA